MSHGLPNALRSYVHRKEALSKFSSVEHYMIKHHKMSSTAGEKEQWPAVRVRETFLDFFKKNGHTFGLVPA